MLCLFFLGFEHRDHLQANLDFLLLSQSIFKFLRLLILELCKAGGVFRQSALIELRKPVGLFATIRLGFQEEITVSWDKLSSLLSRVIGKWLLKRVFLVHSSHNFERVCRQVSLFIFIECVGLEAVSKALH